MEKLVIVPTYNERENIGPLLDQLMGLPERVDVLVVDDASPDGTADLVKERAAREPRIHLLQRSGKLGLGSAYVEGFRYALAQGAEYIFEMDADFSHDPQAIPAFLAAAQDADVVLGSRYLHGVRVVNWPLNRLILSRAANVYTRLITGLPVHDATSNFRLYSRRLLDRVTIESTGGFELGIELTVKAYLLGMKLAEVPTTWRDRTAGTSRFKLWQWLPRYLHWYWRGFWGRFVR